METELRRVLIADDNFDAADTAAMILRIDGRYDVHVVYGGFEAVEEARAFQPDLVILDINMPVMDGYQAAALLRQEQPAGRSRILVALSGRTQHEDVERARLAGFDHHLAKPPGPAFCSLIGSFLDGQRADARVALDSYSGH